jgi:hypothetical protein
VRLALLALSLDAVVLRSFLSEHDINHRRRIETAAGNL